MKRTAHLLSDSGAQVVICDRDTDKAARGLAAGKCSVINSDDVGVAACEENPGIQIPPEAYAYVRYTSGSTGSAKGATKSHRHVLKAVMDFANHFHICPEDRVTCLGFGSIGKHLFESLLTGASCCPFDPRTEGLIDLAAWLLHERTTVYYSFPTAFRHFVSTLSGAESFPDLRLINLEGEPVYAKDVELFRKHFSPDCLLANSLSSAETGTVCLYFVDQHMALPDGPVPVGMEVLVLDDTGNGVGLNKIGEVAVRSRFLACGYWRKPGLTTEKFVPQENNESLHLYRTGDLGRVSRDGCLQLFGRKDFQIKIRSFRVDVAEVETALCNHPELKCATVIGKRDPNGNTNLVGRKAALGQPRRVLELF